PFIFKCCRLVLLRGRDLRDLLRLLLVRHRVELLLAALAAEGKLATLVVLGRAAVGNFTADRAFRVHRTHARRLRGFRVLLTTLASPAPGECDRSDNTGDKNGTADLHAKLLSSLRTGGRSYGNVPKPGESTQE